MFTILKQASLAGVLAVAGLGLVGSTQARADGWGGYGPGYGPGYGYGGGYASPVSARSFAFGYRGPGVSIGIAKGYGTPGLGYGYGPRPGYGPRHGGPGFGGYPGGHCAPPRPYPRACPVPYPPVGYGGVRVDTWSTTVAPYGPGFPW